MSKNVDTRRFARLQTMHNVLKYRKTFQTVRCGCGYFLNLLMFSAVSIGLIQIADNATMSNIKGAINRLRNIDSKQFYFLPARNFCTLTLSLPGRYVHTQYFVYYREM